VRAGPAATTVAAAAMSALFDFQSFLTVVLLFICSCTYYKLINPGGLTQTTGCVHACVRACVRARVCVSNGGSWQAACSLTGAQQQHISTAVACRLDARVPDTVRTHALPLPAGSGGCFGRQRG
jgi:hypothetical protein